MSREFSKIIEDEEDQAVWFTWYGVLQQLTIRISNEEVKDLMSDFLNALQASDVRAVIYPGQEIDLVYDKDVWPYKPAILLPVKLESIVKNDPFQYAKLVSVASYSMGLIRSQSEEFIDNAAEIAARMEALVVRELVELGVVSELSPFHQGLLNYNLYPRDSDEQGYDQ